MKIHNVFKKLALRIGVVLAAVSMAACGAVAQGGGTAAPSNRVVAFLGGDAVALIAATERVEPFLLKTALAPDAKGPGSIAGYVWTARGADLPPKAVAQLKTMLLDDASYDFDVAKKCVMVPEYALRLHAGDKHLDVLVSFACNMWAFQVGGDSRVEDFDPVAGRLKAVIETVFRPD